MGGAVFNLLVGLFALWVAFSPKFRPISWSRFYLNIALALANFVAFVWIVIR